MNDEKKSKSCGIISIYGLNNYGNRLQNYALIHTLQDMGCRCKNFLDLKKTWYIKYCAARILKNQLCMFRRTLLFRKIDKKLVKNVYAKKRKIKRQEHFDYLICGSDQIWTLNLASSYYFAEFAPKEKRIAYAASFGVSSIPDFQKERYRKWLNGFKSISVRESSGAEIINNLIGIDVEVLIDPTMLLSRQEWRELSEKPRFNTDKKYILTYFLGNVDAERSRYINNICKICGLELIDLNAKQPSKFYYKTGPAEFLWLVEHSAVVFTDSFHGSVFSILFEVPFLVFNRDEQISEMSSRIDTLLHTMKLEDRRFNNQTVQDVFKKEYAHVGAILKNEKKRSIAFLEKALNI